MLQAPSVSPAPAGPQRAQLSWQRYLRLLIFFGRLFLDVIFWEVIIRWLLGKRLAARGRSARLRRYARQFRHLAVQMGGVMIKLGQFISARVDVMPPEIIEELSGLQDEVPPEKLQPILRLIGEELGAPPEQIFAEFDPQVWAAASLGQVYRARLHSGERVIVKVQRPGIERIVATDLEALHTVAGWVMMWPAIRKRADIPALLREFAATLWEELDYIAEARNAKRFQELFADDNRVYIPNVYHKTSSRRVLTLEDVTSIKILDREAIDAAGVDRKVAARWLLDIYLRMIFEFGFFHADPHPGNLFIYPLPEEAIAQGYSNTAPDEGRPFYIVFVDFGMVGHITPQVRAGLREALIAVATRDARRVIKAYQMLGMLLPSADLQRIEEVEQEVLSMIWGKSISEMARMGHSEMREFALKYRDLLYEMPFQVPQNFIYLARAVAILAGMCTLLDPDFAIWTPLAQYAQRFIADLSGDNLRSWVDEALALGQVALGLPRQMQDVLTRLQSGQIEVSVRASAELNEQIRWLTHAINRVAQTFLFAGLLISASLLYTGGEITAGLIGFGLAGLTLLSILLGLRRGAS